MRAQSIVSPQRYPTAQGLSRRAACTASGTSTPAALQPSQEQLKVELQRQPHGDERDAVAEVGLLVRAADVDGHQQLRRVFPRR